MTINKRVRISTLVAANTLATAYRSAGYTAFVVMVTSEVFEVRAHKFQ